jgi:hypothetical protein
MVIPDTDKERSLELADTKATPSGLIFNAWPVAGPLKAA